MGVVTNFFYIVIFAIIQSTYGMNNPIYFQKYCLNESNPNVLESEGTNSAGLIIMNHRSVRPAYKSGLNCSVTFFAPDYHELLITFSNISLRNTSFDNLTVIYNNDRNDIVLAGQQVCSNENCLGLKFESGSFRNITLRFISAPNITVPSNLTGFKAHFTVFNFVDQNSGACKGRNRFLCENRHCIANELVCDGHNNCGDRSDETKCIIPVKDTIWGIVTIVMAIICLIIFVPLFCFLAVYGTRSVVKSITLVSEATPLVPTIDCGEASDLLTSSQLANSSWMASTSYERRHSFSYGALPSKNTTDPSTSGFRDLRRFQSFSDQNDLNPNKPL